MMSELIRKGDLWWEWVKKGEGGAQAMAEQSRSFCGEAFKERADLQGK